MLVVNFSVGVDDEFKDEMRNTLMDDYGIEIRKEFPFYKNGFLGKKVRGVYFDCYAPMSRLKMLIDYLENEFTGTAILSY